MRSILIFFAFLIVNISLGQITKVTDEPVTITLAKFKDADGYYINLTKDSNTRNYYLGYNKFYDLASGKVDILAFRGKASLKAILDLVIQLYATNDSTTYKANTYDDHTVTVKKFRSHVYILNRENDSDLKLDQDSANRLLAALK